MTRLYNHTAYDEALLKDILNFAARCAGVTGDVPVKLTYCKQLCGGGMAHKAYPYRKTLIGKPTTSTDKRLLKCPVGWFEVHLPRADSYVWRKPWRENDADIKAAEWFVDTAIHEMSHIRQFRTGWKPREFYGRGAASSSGRRQRHDARPCEIDAYNTVDAVRDNRSREKRRQELVLLLAIELERVVNIFVDTNSAQV